MTASRQVVQIEVAAEEAELAADALWQRDPSAVSEEDLGGGRVRLTADVVDAARLRGLLPGMAVEVLALDSDAYLDAWRDWATPVRAGRRIVLHPAWLPRDDAAQGGAAELTILLDPGRAFGSGSHPTTRLVLAVLETELRAGDRVLDVGTGSGVLAVAAALLGAREVVATDVDATAVEATVANAELNAVAELLTVGVVPLRLVRGPFDVVVANIGARVLQELAADLAGLVQARGRLVLSGLLVEQVAHVLASFPGWTEAARLTEDGWAATVLRPPGTP